MGNEPTLKQIIHGVLLEYSESEGLQSAPEWIPESNYDQVASDIADNVTIHFAQLAEKEMTVCPECLRPVMQSELNTFGGLCENCTELI